MTALQDPETVLAAWLDEGPTDLPDATRRAILTSLPTTPQARRGPLAPWRLSVMNTTSRLAAAAVVAVIAIGGALYLLGQRSGVGAPTPTPTATATAPSAGAPSPTSAAASPVPTVSLDTSAWTTFASPRLGITTKLPTGWAITAATEPWIWQRSDPGPTTNATDRAIGPSDEAFVISSQRLPIGITEAAWWADYLSVDTSGMPAGCFPATRAGYTAITVAAVTGYRHGGLARCNFTEVIVVTGGRAYQLTAYANYDRPSGALFDQGLFDAWLTTVVFQPGVAIDTPSESVGPTGSPR